MRILLLRACISMSDGGEVGVSREAVCDSNQADSYVLFWIFRSRCMHGERPSRQESTISPLSVGTAVLTA